MTRDYGGLTVSLIGAPEHFPVPRLRRALQALGGTLACRIETKSDVVVIGHGAVGRLSTGRLRSVLAQAGGDLRTEHQFLRDLGLLPSLEPKVHDYDVAAFSEQCRLTRRDLATLELFDVLEPDEGHYAFRDLVLARQIRSLLDAGITLPIVIGASVAFRRAAIRHGALLPGAARSVSSRELVVPMGTWLRTVEGRNRPKSLSQDMPLAAYFYDLAEAAERAEGWVLAEQLYLRCGRIDPNDALARFHQARMARRQNRPQEAAILFRNATDIDPLLTDAWFALGELASDRGDADQAGRHFAAALACEPSYADAAFRLAVAHLDHGDVRSALPLFERYAEQDADGRWRKAAFRAARLCRPPASPKPQPQSAVLT
jgi:tetratricopeptide (TPR) repeat protein